jgi:hypothetical protein
MVCRTQPPDKILGAIVKFIAPTTGAIQCSPNQSVRWLCKHYYRPALVPHQSPHLISWHIDPDMLDRRFI